MSTLTVSQLAALLNKLGIIYQAYQHPPLATCRDADRLELVREGTRLKNLFLRDNYGRQHILLITTANKQIDLKALSKQQGLSRLGFASDSRLQQYLGIKLGAYPRWRRSMTPGSMSSCGWMRIYVRLLYGNAILSKMIKPGYCLWQILS